MTAGLGVASSAIVTSAALLRDSGATLNLVGATTPLGGANSQLLFTNAIIANANGPFASLINGILPFATVQGPSSTSLNFATYATPGGAAAFTNYVTSLAAATSTSNVILTTATTLSSSVQDNSLLLLGTLILTAGTGSNNFSLTVGSGAILATSGGTATITGGTVNFGTAEGILIASTGLTINSATTGTGGLTISGAGTVTLNGTGVYTGSTTYNGAGINSGNFAIGTVGGIGNTTLTATAGVIGTSFGGNFSVFSNPIILNNSVVGFGLAAAQPTFAGPITLIGNDFIEATNNTADMAGAIGGAGTLTIGPSGTNDALVLEGANTYSGGTNLDPTGASSSNSTELDVVSPNAFGTGPVNWLGGQINSLRAVVGPAVESASGSVVIPNQINLVNSTAVVSAPWFKAQGNDFVTFSGPINVTGSSAINSLVAANLTISGVISGTGSLTLGTQIVFAAGPSVPFVNTTITLTNANTISGGISLVQATNPVTNETYAGTLILENSAALGTGTFTLSAGTLQDDGVDPLTIANNIQFDSTTTGNSFRSIDDSNTNAPLTITGMVTATAALASAGGSNPGMTTGGTGNVIFDNPIVINNAAVVNSGTTTLAGQATLTATNLIVNPGATLVIDNTTTNNANRIADAIPIALGGTLFYKANTAPGAVSTETLGAVTLNNGVTAGGSTITSDSVPGTTAILTISSLTRGRGRRW